MCYSELLPIKCILVPVTYILNVSDILKNELNIYSSYIRITWVREIYAFYKLNMTVIALY